MAAGGAPSVQAAVGDAAAAQRIAAAQASTTVATATTQAQNIIDQAVAQAAGANAGTGTGSAGGGAAGGKHMSKHEKECHDPPVLVGPKGIPATETMAVNIIPDKTANQPIIDSIETPTQLLTDPLQLQSIDKSIPALGAGIMNVHQEVKTLAEEPLNPDFAVPTEATN